MNHGFVSGFLMGERMWGAQRVSVSTSLTCSKRTGMAVDRWWFGEGFTRMVTHSLILCERHKQHQVMWANCCFIGCAFQTHDLPTGQRPSAFSVKFLRKTTLRHLNAHLDLPIYWTCVGHSWKAHLRPKWRQQREVALLEEWVNIPLASMNKFIQQHVQTLYRCDRQKRLPYTILRLVWLLGCDHYLSLTFVTHY